jgi:hypothetical protein
MRKPHQTEEIDISRINISGFNTRKDLEAGSEDSTLSDLACLVQVGLATNRKKTFKSRFGI